MVENLFPHQKEMIAELVKRGRMDGSWGRNAGKTAALNYAVQAQAVEVGNLYRAYKAGIGHPVWGADFAGIEIRLAEYAQRDAELTMNLLQSVWPGRDHYFDLGDEW